MPPAELAVRMVALKELLSGCDVALLVRIPHCHAGEGYPPPRMKKVTSTMILCTCDQTLPLLFHPRPPLSRL